MAWLKQCKSVLDRVGGLARKRHIPQGIFEGSASVSVNICVQAKQGKGVLDRVGGLTRKRHNCIP